MDKSLFAQRVAAIRQALGLTQEQFAEKVGVSREQVGRWESGRAGTTQKRIEAMCDMLGLTVAEFWDPTFIPSEARRSAGADAVHEKRPITPAYFAQDVVSLPVVGESRAGEPESRVNESRERYFFDAHFVSDEPHFLVRAESDGLGALGIRPGDLLLVKRQSTANTGDIAVVKIADRGSCIRRVQMEGGLTVLVRSSEHPVEIFPTDRVEIVGRVERVIRNV